MFERLPAPDQVIALHFSGMMTADDVARYRSVLAAALNQPKPIGLCVDLTGLADLNAESLAAGAKADLEFLSHLDRFARCAIVSDKQWPAALMGFLGPLLPTLDIKLFESGERDEAIEWAAVLPEGPRTPAPAIHFLPTTKDNVLAFEINGIISASEMPDIIAKTQSFLEQHDRVRLLNRMTRFEGIEPAALLQSGLIPMKLAAVRKVERYAIVGAPGWMVKLIEAISSAFAGMEIRPFPAEREAEAWAWLDAEEATRPAGA